MARRPLLALCLLVASVQSQDYQDYGGGDYQDNYQDYADPYSQQDNLYTDYAHHQQQKEMGSTGGGIGIGKLLLGSAISWMAGGRFHTSRATKKIRAKFQKEQKALYAQYYNDVYKLSEQNTNLQSLIEELKETLKATEAKHELEQIQRDYDEFKQPDIDGDDRISRAEFNMYVKNYLSNYPGLTEKDYPKFEDFDHDGDGYVSFKEYAQQMALQAEQAEQNDETSQALNDLYKDAAKYY